MRHITASDVRSFAKDYWQIVRPYRGPFVTILFWILMMQVVALAEPYAFKNVLDDVVKGKVTGIWYLLKILGVLGGALLLGTFVQVGKNRRINTLIFVMERDMLKVCAKKLFNLPLSFHERENAGLLVSKITKGITKTLDITAILLYEILAIAIQFAVTGAAIAHASLNALCVFAVTVVAFAFATVRIKQRLAPARRRRHDEDSTSYENVGEDIINVSTVQACAQIDRELKKIGDLRDGIHVRALEEFRTHFNWDHLRNAIVNVGRLVVIGLCAWKALGSLMSAGTFVFVVTLTEKVFISCYRIGAIFDRMQEASESVHRMVEVLNEEETIKDPPNPADCPKLEGRIVVERVTHLYSARLPGAAKPSKPALSEVNLEFAPGETIGIVGPSGGGKSTLVKMLMRIDDPTYGRVLLDGIDLRLMRRADFRRQIGYVPQDVEMFSGTIAENIAYGKPEASREEIVAAAKAAYLHEVIMTKPDGYDERVGNHGWRLSGGQRQRVGIARALVMDPRILIFDEATSHVDMISERKIHEAISRLRGGRTIIMIAHRLSTVADADRIVVIDEGRIREIGTHEELKAKAGLYAELVRLQQHAEAIT